MNLTKEYFDAQLKKLATKSDLKNFATKEDLKKFATREEIDVRFEKQTRILMAYTDQQIEKLATMTANGFEELKERLDVQERVKQLENDMKRLKQTLQIR
jgi:predicted PilT family ATPase